MPLPTHFQDAIKKLKQVKNQATYQAAFIFGSAAKKEVTKHSDLDVRIIVSNQATCDSVNHPIINNIKLDLSFNTYTEIEKITNEEIQTAKRLPILAESIILFDKTGQITKLKQKALKAKPKLLSRKKHYWIQFMAHHATSKAKRHLESDPLSALYSFHSNIGEILKFHYQLNRRWWLSDKHLLKDIRIWDPQLNNFLEDFLSTSDVKQKYIHWKQIISHVLQPIGGPKEISDINCICKICQKHLKNLSSTIKI